MKGLTVISSAAAAAALTYLFDPDRGRRRRALMRDKLHRLSHRISHGAAVTVEDTRNRLIGLFAEARSRINNGPVDDHVLAERVRAKIGFASQHPGAIWVEAHNGYVTLGGPVLAEDVERVLKAASSVQGVRGVENRLEVYRQPGDIPGLQGAPARPRGGRIEFLQTYWSPAARLLAVTTGAGLALIGLRRKDILGAAVGTAGLGLLARGITNIELKRLTGIGAGRRAIDLQKTINIQAPVEEVFHFWSHYENFPRVMAHVREVKRSEEQSHWVVSGPAGIPVSWDAVITKLVPNELLAWKTMPGSLVQHAGTVRFQPNPDGSTRIDIKMSYNPGLGALGHVVAWLFGVDPKTAMDQDLVRLKSLIERGKTTAHGEEVRREEVAEETLERPAE